jgi:hypothetical protein
MRKQWTVYAYHATIGGGSTTSATLRGSYWMTWLRQAGAGGTVIAPYLPKKPWFTHLSKMAIELLGMPPIHDLFSPQRQ